jgi:hypothetical protein
VGQLRYRLARFPECREYASAVLLPERFRGRLAPSAALRRNLLVPTAAHSPALTPNLRPTTTKRCGMHRRESMMLRCDTTQRRIFSRKGETRRCSLFRDVVGQRGFIELEADKHFEAGGANRRLHLGIG